ncbi:MAG: A/G-specific adenine glycosylase [Gammaproteobacteria bacterium]|nr:A/G-specific adenine glycosylase [Gammaproteobacteria bacterium]
MLTTLSPQLFQQKILQWYQEQGRKNLPWQKNINAYRVWLSEIMLQQTQVATVIPYFKKFIHAFSTIEDLARAELNEVLKLWAGLGYYSRARNLHACARIIVDQYQSQFPADLEKLQRLPGIGRSTAGAILAFAFHQCAPILDGNVKRVLIRFHAVESQPTLEKLWQLSEMYTPQNNIAAYTQAMMDLGSLICARTKPKCPQCPLNDGCQAYLTNRQDQLPLKKPVQKIPTREVFMLILLNDQNEVLLVQRPPVGIWGGLWSFPETNRKDFKPYCEQEWGYQIQHHQIRDTFTHKFSHFELMITPVLAKVNALPHRIMESPNTIWHNITQELKVGVPRPVQKILSGAI